MCSRGLTVKMNEVAASANLHDACQKWRFMEPKIQRTCTDGEELKLFYQLNLRKKGVTEQNVEYRRI